MDDSLVTMLWILAIIVGFAVQFFLIREAVISGMRGAWLWRAEGGLDRQLAERKAAREREHKRLTTPGGQ